MDGQQRNEEGRMTFSRGNRIVITTRRYGRPAGWARIMGPELVA